MLDAPGAALSATNVCRTKKMFESVKSYFGHPGLLSFSRVKLDEHVYVVRGSTMQELWR